MARRNSKGSHKGSRSQLDIAQLNKQLASDRRARDEAALRLHTKHQCENPQNCELLDWECQLLGVR